MELTKVRPEEAPVLAELYHQSIGSEGCIWNENYPVLSDAEHDTQCGMAYAIRDEDGRILAACSL